MRAERYRAMPTTGAGNDRAGNDLYVSFCENGTFRLNEIGPLTAGDPVHFQSREL